MFYCGKKLFLHSVYNQCLLVFIFGFRFKLSILYACVFVRASVRACVCMCVCVCVCVCVSNRAIGSDSVMSCACGVDKRLACIHSTTRDTRGGAAGVLLKRQFILRE